MSALRRCWRYSPCARRTLAEVPNWFVTANDTIPASSKLSDNRVSMRPRAPVPSNAFAPAIVLDTRDRPVFLHEPHSERIQDECIEFRGLPYGESHPVAALSSPCRLVGHQYQCPGGHAQLLRRLGSVPEACVDLRDTACDTDRQSRPVVNAIIDARYAGA